MGDHDDISEIIEIDFEVGHSSIIRSEATTIHNPPRTHDWKIFLRSADINGDLSCLIQRCIFHLHPEFPNNKRELKTTPFAIQETGYAGFHLPIEIYFKTKKEPKKFRIDYDLDLHKNIDDHPYRQKESYLRKYRCTFYNPDSNFRQKILAAGGKIVDSGPTTSTESDIDEDQVVIKEPIVRQSPPQKRSASPITTANGINNKKIKLEQPINNLKKKQVQSGVNKTIMNNKKNKFISHKSSSVLEDKISKNFPMKDLNQTINIHENTQNSLLSKSRTSTKLIKSQSTNDIKSSIQSTITNTKKKESLSSPSKSKSITTSQTVLKKPINKNSQKISIKTESISTLPINSSLNVTVKQELSPQPSSTTTPSVSISNLKKIPKKSLPPKIEEKRSRSSMPSSLLNRNSKNLQNKKIVSSKTQSNLKRDHSSSSIHNTDQPRKTKIIKDHSVKQSRIDQSNHQKPTSSSQSHIDLSIIDTSQPSISTSSSSHVFQNEDYHPPINDDLSDKSNSPHEQIPNQSIKIPYSDPSDTNDSDLSLENNEEEEDLPASLTNDDLRYKLIYIYKRFQLNSINDLIIFVRFFKRNQLIDISSLSMTKTTNDMWTYDLFSLSPSHIGELANDLGYTTMNMINSIE